MTTLAWSAVAGFSLRTEWDPGGPASNSRYTGPIHQALHRYRGAVTNIPGRHPTLSYGDSPVSAKLAAVLVDMMRWLNGWREHADH